MAGAAFEEDPREFRTARLYRRGVLYALLGWSALLLPILVWDFAEWPWPGRVARFVGLSLVATLPAWLIFQWRVRIDAEGVHRRSLFAWKTWPWWAFEDGEIQHGLGAYSFRWPARWGTERTLTSFG